MPAPRVSVVVPTRDRPGSLEACLRALGEQSVHELEVVVVDDASRDAGAVRAVVEAAGGARFRLRRGAGRGPAAARNLGARAARADVVAFTDDDCRPHPGWAAALLGRLETGADVVAGPTCNGRPDDAFAAASQTITNHLTDSSFDPARGVVGFAPTSNVACRREVHRCCPFDETFPLAAGEDREWCARLAALGIGLAFEPDAWVSHHQDLSFRRFWRQQARYGRGAQHHLERSAGADRLRPWRFYATLARKGFSQGPAVGGLVLLAQVATATGVGTEVLARRFGA